MRDYISREEVMKVLAEIYTFYGREVLLPHRRACLMNDIDTPRTAIEFAEKEVLAIPPADVAPVNRWEWEWKEPCIDSRGMFWATCSACQIRQRLGDYETYCPNCGARMRRVEPTEEEKRQMEKEALDIVGEMFGED